MRPAHRYEPQLNRTDQEWVEHYGVAILSARKRKHRDKAKAEQGVLLVERWIVAHLRDRQFFSLGELNAELLVWRLTPATERSRSTQQTSNHRASPARSSATANAIALSGVPRRLHCPQRSQCFLNQIANELERLFRAHVASSSPNQVPHRRDRQQSVKTEI